MNLRKLLMMFITTLLAVALVACGGGGNSNGDGNGNGNGGGSQNGGSSNQNDDLDIGNPNASPEMDFDLGGRTLTFVSWWNMEIGDGNPDDLQRRENLERLMEKHNFKVDYIALDFGEYQERVVASLMAGEPLGDYVRMGRKYMIPSLVKQDMFWPVDEWTKNENVFNQLVTTQYSQYNGRGYGFNDQENLITGIFYNRTLMNELGIKPLQDYVDEGNWNWETFKEVAKSANLDRDNDGQLDTWGLTHGDNLDQLLASNETDWTNGSQHNLEDQRVIEAMNFLLALYTEGAVRPSEGGDWTEPRAFFVQGNTLMYPGAMYEVGGLKNDMADYDIGFLPFPMGPSATQYHAVEPDVQFLTIPKVVENPRELLYIYEKIHDIDSMYDYKGQAGLESNFHDENDINNARVAGDNMRVVDRLTYPNMPYYELVDDLKNGVSVSTVIETYKAQFQASIDEVWN